MAAEGKDTSEHKFAKASKYINVALAVGATVMTSMDPETLAYAIIAGVVALGNTFMSSGYSASRGVAKAGK